MPAYIAARRIVRVLAAACTLAGAAAQAQAPTHAYTLNGTYADVLGGPSLVALGGTAGPTGYSFAANQGLSLSNATNGANYSIEMTFNFAANASLSSWRKVLDFKNRGSDEGVYSYNQRLQFFGPGAIADVPAIVAGSPFHLLVTRDALSNVFSAFINGQQQFTFVDANQQATFTGPGNVIHFLTDDVIVTGEAAPGSIDWIRIYDRPLDAAEAAARYQLGDNPLQVANSTVPEPGTVALLATGLVAVGGVAARRRRTEG